MKIVIIEDEPLAADILEKLVLKLRPGTKVMAKLESIEESVAYFQEGNTQDLIFCDIHLSDGNSFEIFQQVNIETPVIFTTAFDQYALEAFKMHSIDYLLKPVKEEELERAISKFEKSYQPKANIDMDALQKVMQQFQGAGKEPKEKVKSRFMVKKGQNMVVVPTDKIAYFFGKEGLVYLIDFSGEKYMCNQTLDQLEEQLDPNDFFRANRQFILHIQAVEKIKPYFKGRLYLELQPPMEEECVVSSAKASLFKDWIES